MGLGWRLAICGYACHEKPSSRVYTILKCSAFTVKGFDGVSPQKNCQGQGAQILLSCGGSIVGKYVFGISMARGFGW